MRTVCHTFCTVKIHTETHVVQRQWGIVKIMPEEKLKMHGDIICTWNMHLGHLRMGQQLLASKVAYETYKSHKTGGSVDGIGGSRGL